MFLFLSRREMQLSPAQRNAALSRAAKRSSLPRSEAQLSLALSLSLSYRTLTTRSTPALRAHLKSQNPLSREGCQERPGDCMARLQKSYNPLHLAQRIAALSLSLAQRSAALFLSLAQRRAHFSLSRSEVQLSPTPAQRRAATRSEAQLSLSLSLSLFRAALSHSLPRSSSASFFGREAGKELLSLAGGLSSWVVWGLQLAQLSTPKTLCDPLLHFQKTE